MNYILAVNSAMLLRVLILGVLLVTANFTLANFEYKKIIIGTFEDQHTSDETLLIIKDILLDNEKFIELNKRYHFDLVSRVSGDYFIISAEPFRDDKSALQVLEEIRKIRKAMTKV